MGFVEEVVYGLAQGIQGGYSTMAFVTQKKNSQEPKEE